MCRTLKWTPFFVGAVISVVSGCQKIGGEFIPILDVVTVHNGATLLGFGRDYVTLDVKNRGAAGQA